MELNIIIYFLFIFYGVKYFIKLGILIENSDRYLICIRQLRYIFWFLFFIYFIPICHRLSKCIEYYLH